jgi:hypothetical protein
MQKFTENSRSAEKKDERARQTERAMQEYNARRAAISAKTEQLRSLRLARDAAPVGESKAAPRRAKKQTSVVA